MDPNHVGEQEPAVPQAEHGRIAKASWRSLFNFSSRRHASILICALFLSIAAGITGPALAIFFGKIFDAFSEYGSGQADGDRLMDNVTFDAIALCVLGGTIWLLKGGYFGLWMVFGELQAKNVRDRLFQDLLKKDLEWYDLRESGIGALLPRLQTQIRELQIGTSQPLGFSVQYVVQALASFGLAFYTSWKLTLVILAGLPPAAIVLSFISSMMQPSIIKQEIQLSLASKVANSALSAIETVKCFNGQSFELQQYKNVIFEAAKHYIRQALSNSLQIGFIRFVTTAMFVQGFWYGGYLVRTNKTSAGDVLTTFWACLMATKAIEDILPHMLVLERGRAAGAAMTAILDQVSRGNKINDSARHSAPKYCDGDIEIRKVSFAYPSRPDTLVLKESTFFFPAGETTFVVGRSGSGKSTMGNLLMRFYDATTGTVFVDGKDISQLDINWLRNNISLVQQQSILFNETIFRNISFGQRDYLRVTKHQVKDCIDLAALQATINEMPRGLDTQVGSGGNSLSGGQKQRVAVARARLRDTPILILDESTSALDYVSRKAVMEAVRQWRHGKTTIVITHDVSQIRDADFVYALEAGRIIEEGYRHTLKALEQTVVDPPPVSSATVPVPFRFDLQRSSSQAVPQNRYSSFFLDTNQAVHRQDSMELLLDQIEESSGNLRPQVKRLSVAEPKQLPESQRRGSVGNMLSAARRRSSIRMQQGSTLQPADSTTEVDPRRLTINAPTTFDIHRTLTRSGRPMSMHQAMVMKNIYGESMLPTERRSSVIPPPTSPITLTDSTKDNSTDSGESQPSPKPKREQTTGRHDVAPIRTILQTVWPSLSRKRRMQLVLGFTFALIHAAGPPSFSYVFSQLLGTFFIKENQERDALIYSMAILGIAIVDAISDGCMHFLLEKCGQSWVDHLRLQAFERILDQPRAWFDEDENSLADLTSCLDRNAEEMRNLVGRFAPFLVVVAAMMSIAAVWSLAVCWKVTLVGIAAAPSLYLITKGFEKVSSKWENLTNNAGNKAGSTFVETFTDIRTVRALTLESYFHKKYNKATSEALVVGLKRAAYCGFFFGASDSAINFVTALVFWYGAKVAQEGEFSVKSILTVFSMLLFSTANANAVIAYIPQISSSADTATRLLRLANLPLHQSHEYSGKIQLDPSDPKTFTGPIEFTNLTFSYPSRGLDSPALCSLTLTISNGQSTALVGPSGSGKSTIASLLLALYPPPSSHSTSTSTSTSHLTLSHSPIQTLSTPSLRHLIAIVPQCPTLFPTTVRSNITYGLPPSSPHTSLTAIHTAARQAGIHDFLTTLPQGYDTPIGDGGLGLSGGQAQRVAIARALCRRPRVLILDEATSALDGEAAELIRQTVLELVRTQQQQQQQHHRVQHWRAPQQHWRKRRQGQVYDQVQEEQFEQREQQQQPSQSQQSPPPPPPMTVIIITHAREMMACAENVIVLDHGHAVEQGGFEDLVARPGGVLAGMLSG